MNSTHRNIPEWKDHGFNGMHTWPEEMAAAQLIFQPDEDAGEIVHIQTGQPFFIDAETTLINATLSSMFSGYDDRVYDAAYPAFMRACGHTDTD